VQLSGIINNAVMLAIERQMLELKKQNNLLSTQMRDLQREMKVQTAEIKSLRQGMNTTQVMVRSSFPCDCIMFISLVTCVARRD